MDPTIETLLLQMTACAERGDNYELSPDDVAGLLEYIRELESAAGDPRYTP